MAITGYGCAKSVEYTLDERGTAEVYCKVRRATHLSLINIKPTKGARRLGGHPSDKKEAIKGFKKVFEENPSFTYYSVILIHLKYDGDVYSGLFYEAAQEALKLAVKDFKEKAYETVTL